MLPSRSKSGLPETPNSKASQSALNRSGLSETSNKTTPATPRVSKLARTPSKSESNSPSPLQSSRPSVDRSPRSVESKLAIERRSPKITTPTDKQPRVVKGTGLQTQLAEAQEELRKAKEHFASVEKEKAQVLEELKDAKKLAAEANEKLEEALAAQKRAQENLEIEKFRADELEQAAIEAAQKREDEWQKELESVHNQHAVDVSALLTTTQELQRVQQELTMTTEAKNVALSHADDAMKIAEINAEKVEILSSEVAHLKGLLDSKLEAKTNEAAELVVKLNSEVDSLKSELQRGLVTEKKVVEMEALIEALRTEVTDAKRAEANAGILMDEWKKKAELLEARVEEAIQSEKSALDSLALTIKKLEECNASLQDAESDITSLKGKVEALENEIVKQKGDLDESNHHLQMSKQEVLEMEHTTEVLKSELQNIEEEKQQALDDAKQAVLTIQSLRDEKNTILNELEVSRDEGEKSKKAMEGLASALHEISGEARESQERFLIKQAEVAEANVEIERLKIALITKDESYEAMLSEAKDEISCLKHALERSEQEMKDLRFEFNEKELSSMSTIKSSKEEIGILKEEMSKMISKLEGAEAEAKSAKQEGVELFNRLKQAELKVDSANEAMEEAKAENLRLKERLLDKENELQSITQENDDLRAREEAAVKKVEELSALLEEATDKKTVDNNELSSSEKEYDFLPKPAEIPEDNADENVTEKTKPVESLGLPEVYNGGERKQREENVNGNVERKEPVDEEANSWENCNVTGDLPPEEHEQESLDDDVQSKLDGDSLGQTNGLSLENVDNGSRSPNKQQDLKKKKPLLHKFGNLLRKKSNQK
uniref:WEB family protein At4g27595, chloroplastic n=1 Tax=Anthurium amnicola TaxID=1678845 RepID=A0A1D1YD59_9ARAE